MVIFNITMHKKQGGLVNSFIDYSNILREKHQVIDITSIFSIINRKLPSIKLPNLVINCIFSKIYLLLLISIYKPDVIIAHGGRAVILSQIARKKNIKLIAVAHDYKIRYLGKCDYIIALHKGQRDFFKNEGYKKENIFIVPNMVDLAVNFYKLIPNQHNVIGYLGRISKEKGVAVLIEAINILKEKQYNVKLVIAGEGKEKKNIQKLVAKHNLENEVNFIGWINDKKQFFKEIDIFAFPSSTETFGISLLEAMNYQTAIATTKNQGALNILEDQVDCVMSEIDSSTQLAGNIAYLINNPIKAKYFAENAYKKIINFYDSKIVIKQLITTIETIANI